MLHDKRRYTASAFAKRENTRVRLCSNLYIRHVPASSLEAIVHKVDIRDPPADSPDAIRPCLVAPWAMNDFDHLIATGELQEPGVIGWTGSVEDQGQAQPSPIEDDCTLRIMRGDDEQIYPKNGGRSAAGSLSLGGNI